MNAGRDCLAAIFHGPQQGIRLERISFPRLACGEALVRVEATTLCGSDLRTFAGLRDAPVPTILGHEVVGHVVESSGDVRLLDGDALRLGDRVVWSVIVACGACERCRCGLPQKCLSLVKFGHAAQPVAGGRLDGGLAEFVHLPRGTTLIRVERDLPAALAAQATCAAATAVACLRVAQSGRSLAGARVLVHGAGALGLFATRFARDLGAAEVHVVDLDHTRLELASTLGATTTHRLPAGPGTPCPEHLEFEVARGFDVALELSGEASACERSLAAASIGGRVVLAGTVSPSGLARFDPELLVRRLVRVEGVHNYVAADLVEALQRVGAPGVTWPDEIAQPPRVSLAAVASAFALAHELRPLRVLVTPT